MSNCQYGPEGACGRKSCRRVKGKAICHSHRRMWLAGKPLETPVRGYQRYEEGPDGVVRACVPRPPRRKPFVKEFELLRSMGLR